MPNDDQQRLEALKRFFVLDHTESEEETARLVRVAAQVYGVAYAVLTLREGEDERVAAAYGFDPAALPEDAVFCERAAGPSIPLTVADASDDARFAKNPLVHGPQAARFYAGVPLKSADGFTLGTLALLDPTAQELNGEGLAMLVDLGALVEPALNLQR
ncbi:MAG TPA: GAF domain-containing protein, partial [Rubricoccaceae bacterium]|nr:GAF domain-containing protein [Rubricoccaceae bacterium]